MSSASGYMGAKYFQEFGPRSFDTPSASGYMGEKYFQEFGPIFLTCPQLVGTWVQNMFRNLVKNICRSSAKSICYFSVCHWVFSQGSTHNNRGARPRCGATHSPARHLLLAEDRYLFLTCLQLVGTWVRNSFRNLVQYFLTSPQLVDTWVPNIFRN